MNTDEIETCKACERGFYKDNTVDDKFGSCNPCDDSTTDVTAATSVDMCQYGNQRHLSHDM